MERRQGMKGRHENERREKEKRKWNRRSRKNTRRNMDQWLET